MSMMAFRPVPSCLGAWTLGALNLCDVKSTIGIRPAVLTLSSSPRGCWLLEILMASLRTQQKTEKHTLHEQGRVQNVQDQLPHRETTAQMPLMACASDQDLSADAVLFNTTISACVPSSNFRSMLTLLGSWHILHDEMAGCLSSKGLQEQSCSVLQVV